MLFPVSTKHWFHTLTQETARFYSHRASTCVQIPLLCFETIYSKVTTDAEDCTLLFSTETWCIVITEDALRCQPWWISPIVLQGGLIVITHALGATPVFLGLFAPQLDLHIFLKRTLISSSWVTKRRKLPPQYNDGENLDSEQLEMCSSPWTTKRFVLWRSLLMYSPFVIKILWYIFLMPTLSCVSCVLCLCLCDQDPTNGYYNVRASTHDEGRPASRSTMHYSDYRSPAGTPGGAASISSSAGGSGATASGGAPGPPGPLTSPGRPQACYDPRPPSRLSHISYAQFNTFTRGGQSQQPPTNPAPAASDFPGDCSLLESTSQLAYDNYGYPSHYQTYRMGFAPSSLAPLEAGPSYEMYGVGSGVGGPGVGVSPGGPAPSGSETGLGKYGSSTRFSYTSQHSDYSHSRHTQRMQTHVWDRETCTHLTVLAEHEEASYK